MGYGEDLDALLATEQYARNPHPVNHALRQYDPVFWSSTFQAWMPTRYVDVRALLLDHKHLSSKDVNLSRLGPVTQGLAVRERQLLSTFFGFEGLFQNDLPHYKPLRRVVAAALQRHLQHLAAAASREASGVVKSIINRYEAGDIVDLVSDLARPVPRAVLFEWLGVDEAYREACVKWAATLSRTYADRNGTAAIQSATAIEQAAEWLSVVVEERKRHPRDDAISTIARSPEFSEVPQRDLLSTFIFLLLAGQETTASLIASCCRYLLVRQDVSDHLRQHRDLVPIAIEEVLRYESPIQTAGRVALEDIEVGGKLVRSGSPVVMMYGAANRDPERFPSPDVCDFSRDASKHLAFGSGLHFCIGASLARLEAAVVLNLLLDRPTNFMLANEVLWSANVTFRGLESLKVGLS
jgi:pimeloyl-[acyl-carrier protein] synthase